MKFSDILCEHAPVSEDWSESGVCAWPNFQPAPAPPFPPTEEGDADRKFRSRSSPVRTSIEDEWVPPRRARSPSASPRAAAALNNVHMSPERYPVIGRHSRQTRHTVRYQPLSYISYSGGTSFGCRSSVARVSAYYSVKPPAMPLKLVPVAPSLPPTVPGLPTRSANSSPQRPSIAAALAAQLDEERCKNAVRSVLCELLTALPLSASSSPGRRTHASHVPYASHEPRNMHAPRASRPKVPKRPAPPVPPDPLTHASTIRTASPTTFAEADEHNCHMSPENIAWSVRSAGSVESTGSVYSAVTSERIGRQYAGHHVGTQARGAGAVGNVRNDISSQEPLDNPDEWLGGVRALRDSHVRLVLRQLRHIERLNRALDRAARTSPGSPGSRAVHASTSASKPMHKTPH